MLSCDYRKMNIHYYFLLNNTDDSQCEVVRTVVVTDHFSYPNDGRRLLTHVTTHDCVQKIKATYSAQQGPYSAFMFHIFIQTWDTQKSVENMSILRVCVKALHAFSNIVSREQSSIEKNRNLNE